MNPPNTTAPSIPDDIRLKCSYYASEIKTQVNSLFQEQHKWLDDHLNEIKETLDKVTEKKAGTRAVMAGIIKTPSRKRTKRISKNISKSDHVGLDASGNSSSVLPLSELKRSQLNMNSQEVQDIINQQLEKERKEIELRLQKELSLLDHQYESPVKKNAASSTLISADIAKPHPPPFWNPVESLLSSKVTSTSSLSGPIKHTDENIFSLSSSSNNKANHSEPLIKCLGPYSPGESELDQDGPSHETDPDDAFAAAGHELSAIQEGEEEDDHHLAEPLPSLPKSLASNQSTKDILPSVQPKSHLRKVNSVSTAPSPAKPATPATEPTTTSTLPNRQPTTPLPKPQSPHRQHVTTHVENLDARVEDSHRPALSSDSPSVPETNSVDAGGFDSDHVPPRAPHSGKAPDINNLSGDISQGATPNAFDVPTSENRTTTVPLDSHRQNSTATSTFNNASSDVVNIRLTPEHPAIDSPEQTTSLPSNLDQGQGNGLERTEVLTSSTATTSIPTTTPTIKQEFDQNAQQPSLQEAPHSLIPKQSHVDTVVEIPLSDNPSSLRNNLYASIGSSHSDKQVDHTTRTPGEPTTSNLFTPGNPRAAVLQSPHSQWSSKPSGAMWTQHKPYKTPATISNLGAASQVDRTDRIKGTLSGSPFEDYSKPLNLLSNLQSTVVQQSLVSSTPLASSLTQPIPITNSQTQHPRQSGLKRTSTDAGFNHTSDAHDAKMSRSHTPGMMHIRQSTAGGTARKGMEDLKSRLSKIQRESAMHERVHHHPSSSNVDAPLGVIPRTSLVTHTSAPSFSKATPTLNSSASAVSTTKTFPITHPVAGEQLDRDRTTEIPNTSQPVHIDFSMPVELSTSFKVHKTVQPSTEPINLPRHATAVDASTSSKMCHEDLRAESRGAHSSEAETRIPQKRTSSSSSVSSMVAAHEAKTKNLVAQVPVAPLTTVDPGNGLLLSSSEVPSVPPTTRIESKHLAFLKGAIETSTSPPPSKVLDKSRSPPPSNTDCPSNRPVESEHSHPEAHAESDNEEGEDYRSVASSKLSEPNGMNDEHENDNASSQGDEDDEKHSESEDEASNDDDVYEEPSVEIVRPKANQIFNHSDHEQDTRNQQELNENDPRHALQSDVVKTPRNVPATPSSPMSNGLMGVFRAGAVLASSWTASKAKPERPELKSLQLAAAAAKKEQDDRDRKATLKEERRLLAVEKRQAEEKTKAENEKKARMAEVEKKKQEREDAMKARSTFKVKVPSSNAPPGSRQASMTGDAAKKRKMENDSHRTVEPKKTKAPQPVEGHSKIPSSAQKAPTSSYLPTRTAPTAPGSAMKTAPGSAIKATGSKSQQVGGSSTHTKQGTQAKTNLPSRPVSQLSQHSGFPKSAAIPQQNASQSSHSNANNASKNAQAKGKKREEQKVVEDEYIELPDIDSEYSDDDESEHERKEAKLPDWAQSPALREALANQRKVNPDDVFGGSIPAPRMDEIFRGRTSKFRHRTSSANWTGADQLTAMEEAEYAKRMGYHNKKRSAKR